MIRRNSRATRPQVGLTALCILALSVVPASAAEREGRLHAPPVPGVLHAASAAPWAVETMEIGPGRWTFDVTTGYLNLWRYSWHPGTVHRRLGRLGEPFGADLPAEIADRFPDADAHQIDVDAFRSDVRIARGFAGGWSVSVRIPWIRIGSPGGDGIAEAFHDTFGFKEQRRDYFPRGETTVYAQGDSGLLFAQGEQDGASLGDVAVTVAAPLGEALGGRHRWALTVEAPTGDDGTLRGSGGWDVAAGWTGAWAFGSYAFVAGAGYAILDSAGSFLGVERENTWHAGAELSRPLGSRWSAYVAVRLDTSPLDGYAGLSDPLLAAQFGVGRRVFGDWRAILSSSQNLGGPTADFGFHLALSTTWGAP